MAEKLGAARRYAEAVFELGQGKGTLDRWRTDLAFLKELFASRRLTVVLGDPRVGFPTKEAIVRDLAGTQVSTDALGLALLLTEQGVTEAMPRIADEFEHLYDDYRNQATAVVTTASPLDESVKADLIAFLQRVTGKTIRLETKIDPSILGGAIARIGDTLIDGSVRRRLDLLRDDIATGTFATTTTS